MWTGNQRPPRWCQEGLNKAPAVLLLLLMWGVWELLVVLEPLKDFLLYSQFPFKT